MQQFTIKKISFLHIVHSLLMEWKCNTHVHVQRKYHHNKENTQQDVSVRSISHINLASTNLRNTVKLNCKLDAIYLTLL